jgi:hypothetical protein
VGEIAQDGVVSDGRVVEDAGVPPYGDVRRGLQGPDYHSRLPQ